MNQGFVCQSGRHFYPSPTGAELNCCASFRLAGDRDKLVAAKKSLEGQLEEAGKNIVAARREVDSLQEISKKLESNLADIKVKRHEALARGSLPGGDASLGSLPSDIEAIRSSIADKSARLQTLLNNSSTIGKQLAVVNHELARFDLHARRDAVHEKMRKALLEWNEHVKEILTIRQEAGADSLQPGDLNFGEFPLFPIGVWAPGWAANPEQRIQLLALQPVLNLNAAGKHLAVVYAV